MTDLAGQILILSGPPGSGKTTIARALADKAGSRNVHLHLDDFWDFIRFGAIPPYLPEAHEQNGIVMNVVAGAASTYATGGYFVIVDGIIGPWFLAPFRILRPKVHYVVLRPPLDLAIERCRQRGGNTLTDPKTIALLHSQFSSLGDLEQHVLPVGERTLEDALAAVAEAAASRKYVLSG